MVKFENKSNGRYYYLVVETDLFGDNVLNITRGGAFFNRRNIRSVSGSMEEIQREITRLTKIRLQRGYTLVNS